MTRETLNKAIEISNDIDRYYNAIGQWNVHIERLEEAINEPGYDTFSVSTERTSSVEINCRALIRFYKGQRAVVQRNLEKAEAEFKALK